MATEAKMGMFIIVILVGAFGFLVYHKFDLRQRQLLAEMKSAADTPSSDSAQQAADSHAASFEEFQPGPDVQGDLLAAHSELESLPQFDDGSPLEPAFTDERENGGEAFAALNSGPDSEIDAATDAAPFDPAAFDPAPFDPATTLAAADTTPGTFDNLLEPAPTATEPTPNADADPFVAFDGPSTAAPAADEFSPFGAAATDTVPQPTSDSPPAGDELLASTETADLFPPVDAFPPADTLPPADAFPPAETPTTVDAFPSEPLSAEPSAADPFPAPDSFPATERAAATEVATVDPLTPAPFPTAGTSDPAAANPFDAPGLTAANPQNNRPAIPETLPPTTNTSDEFMANVGPETVTPAEPVAFQSTTSATDADSAPPLQTQAELTPLLPLEPADPIELDPRTAVAMLDPGPDVNLFEDPRRPSGPPMTDPQDDFPTAAEPEAPDFPGFDEAPRTFGGSPTTQTFADSRTPPETVTPPETNLFAEPISPAGAAPRQQTDQETVPAPRDPSPVTSGGTSEGERVFGGIVPPPTPRPYDERPQYEDNPPLDVNAPGVGVAHIVPGASRIKLTAATEECAICEVQHKDNYWTISRRAYGTSRYFSSLAEYNRERIPDPRKLRPGMKVLVPDPKILEARYPEYFKDQKRLAERKLPTGFFIQQDGTPAYRVGPRETLGEISQRHLGRASRWIQIFRMNQRILQDPNKLKPGIVITLPDDATNVQIRP